MRQMPCGGPPQKYDELVLEYDHLQRQLEESKVVAGQGQPPASFWFSLPCSSTVGVFRFRTAARTHVS